MSTNISAQSSVTSSDLSQKQRKFISAVGKPGLARQAREAVAQAVRHSAVHSSSNNTKKCSVPPPLDYENFLVKNRTHLQNHANSDMLFFPTDDVAETSKAQLIRTTVSSVTSKHFEEARSSLLGHECLKSYTSDWHLVHFNYDLYSTDFAPLIRCCPSEDLVELQYEVDLTNDDHNLEVSQSDGATDDEKITKEGYLLKGPESSNDDYQVLFKNFKRRYCFLRKDLDGSHKIDFCKDKPKSLQASLNLKATIYLDLCMEIVKASKKNKSYLELKMINENRKTNEYLTAENEQILDEWLLLLQSIIEKNQKMSKAQKTDDSASVGSTQTNESDSSKEETIERLRPPDFVKFSKETEENVALLRRISRQNPFAVYSNLEPFVVAGDGGNFNIAKVKPLTEKFGVRFMVEFKGLSIKLPLPGDLGECQLEPLFVSIFLFDARDGKRLSETFHCDVNPLLLKQMLPAFQTASEKNGALSRKSSLADSPPKKVSNSTDNSNYSFVDIRGLASEWILKLDRKALFSVTHPNSDTFLVVHVDKILQGSVQSGQEAYVKHDTKLGQKIQKSMPIICSKLGHYRMPFVWTAKPVFQQFIGGTESSRDTLPVYRQDSTKLCDEELVKLISEMKKQDKSSKLSPLSNCSIVINVDVAVKPETLTNCVTSTFLPVASFVEPQSNGSLTFEIESFSSVSDTVIDSTPFVTYSNSLYVYPVSLKYDNQRTFSKARNICCFVEFRDSDIISTPPIKCIHGRHGFDGSLFVTRAGTTISHHETVPQYYDEIKITLPAHVTDKHHLLFTFCHVGVESALASKNKKDSPEIFVGYSWLCLNKNGKFLTEEDFSLPVASVLLDGYLSCELLGLNKGYSGPDVKLVEGGRQLFRVSTRLCSTVMTRDLHLQTFFHCCQRLKECGTFSDAGSPDKTKKAISDADSVTTNSCLDEVNVGLGKNLALVETRCLINFLPTILNQLFSLLESATAEEMALGTVRALIHCVNEVCQANKRNILHAYIKLPVNTIRITKIDLLKLSSKKYVFLLIFWGFCTIFTFCTPTRREFKTINSAYQNSYGIPKGFLLILCGGGNSTGFQINFANSIAGKNDVIVLADRDTLPYLTGDHPNVIANRLSRDRVMQANVDDIWIRDFGTVRQTSPVLLGYAPGYLNRRTAKSIKNSFVAFLKSAGINVAQTTAPNNNGLALTYFSDLVVDGGNVVDDIQTTAILTDRSVLENPQYANDKDRFKADLRKALGYPNITLISQYGDKDADTTGHSDGMVSFLDANTLAYSRMEKDKRDKMLRELRAGLGSRTKFVELPSYYVDETDYHGFSSACGLHINSLVTKDYVYMPVFGHDPEAQRKGYSVANDDLVYGIIRQNTRKQVVRVPVPYKVCILGGSVRCLSMQIEGPVADRLLSLVSGNNAG